MKKFELRDIKPKKADLSISDLSGWGDMQKERKKAKRREAFEKRLKSPEAKAAYKAAFNPKFSEKIKSIIGVPTTTKEKGKEKAKKKLSVNEEGTWLTVHKELMEDKELKNKYIAEYKKVAKGEKIAESKIEEKEKEKLEHAAEKTFFEKAGEAVKKKAQEIADQVIEKAKADALARAREQKKKDLDKYVRSLHLPVKEMGPLVTAMLKNNPDFNIKTKAGREFLGLCQKDYHQKKGKEAWGKVIADVEKGRREAEQWTVATKAAAEMGAEEPIKVADLPEEEEEW